MSHVIDYRQIPQLDDSNMPGEVVEEPIFAASVPMPLEERLTAQKALISSLFEECDIDFSGELCLEELRIVMKGKGYSDSFVEVKTSAQKKLHCYCYCY